MNFTACQSPVTNRYGARVEIYLSAGPQPYAWGATVSIDEFHAWVFERRRIT
jgi:hypothetical protein